MPRRERTGAESEDAGTRPIGVGGNSGAELKHMLERIERVTEEKKDLQSDIKDLFLEAKSKGFDPKIMRIILRRRAMDKAERDEQDAMVETYENAVA